MFNSYSIISAARSGFSRSLIICMAACILIAVTGPAARAQNAQTQRAHEDLGIKPIHVTMKLFQVRVPNGKTEPPTDQTFKVRTGQIVDHDKWISTLKKSYPVGDIAILRTEFRRVFRTSKPTTISLARSQDGSSFDLSLNGAQSYGDGTTPGTSLIPELNANLPKKSGNKPTAVSIQSIEVDSGYSYYYVISNFKLPPADYAKYFRLGENPQPFERYDYYIGLAFSVELEKDPQSKRYFDERASAGLEEKATRRVQLETPQGIKDLKLNGFIRVKVEISAEGKVVRTDIQSSSIPEVNDLALAAARQWEFPQSLFSEDKTPITGFVTFRISDKPEAGKPPSQQ